MSASQEEDLLRMATVVRDSNDAITIQDFEGRITAWNRGAELMYGYSEEEALAVPLAKAVVFLTWIRISIKCLQYIDYKAT